MHVPVAACKFGVDGILLRQVKEGGDAAAAKPAGQSAAVAPALPPASHLSAEEVESGRHWSAKVLLMAGMDSRCALRLSLLSTQSGIHTKHAC